MHLRAYIGEDEEVGIINLRSQPFVTLIREVNTVLFLVDNEIQHIGSLVHTAVIVLHVNLLGGEHTSLDTWLREELDKRFVLGQSLVRAEE